MSVLLSGIKASFSFSKFMTSHEIQASNRLRHGSKQREFALNFKEDREKNVFSI